jgi:hypothetical protein
VSLGLLAQPLIFQEVRDGYRQRLAIAIGAVAIGLRYLDAMGGSIQFERLSVALGEGILSVLADRQSDPYAIRAPV